MLVVPTSRTRLIKLLIKFNFLQNCKIPTCTHANVHDCSNKDGGDTKAVVLATRPSFTFFWVHFFEGRGVQIEREIVWYKATRGAGGIIFHLPPHVLKRTLGHTLSHFPTYILSMVPLIVSCPICSQNASYFSRDQLYKIGLPGKSIFRDYF